MEPGKLQLKFGTALFTFRSEDQMRVFLEDRCVVRAGRIHLHHGDNLHFFTELSGDYLKNLPKGVKVPAFARYMVNKGGDKKGDEIMSEK